MGDVVLTTRGTIGNVAIFDHDAPFTMMRINSGMVILRDKADVIGRALLYHFIRSPFYKQQIRIYGSGSAQPQLPISALQEFLVPIMNLDDRRRVMGLLDNIDVAVVAARARSSDLTLMYQKSLSAAIG